MINYGSHYIDKEDIASVVRVLKSTSLTTGIQVNNFEKNLNKYFGCKDSAVVSSGTAALEVAIKSLNLKKNSEILIPSFSIISTANAVIKNNLKPVLIDCDLDTWNMSVEQTLKKITKRTKAIIITHIYGLPVNMGQILNVAKKKKLLLSKTRLKLLD